MTHKRTISGKRRPLPRIANVLTLFRISIVPFFVLALFGQTPVSALIALVLFSVAALTDYLDGLLARKLDAQSSFGQFLDPLADKLLVGGAFVSFALMPEFDVPLWLVLVILVREVVVTLMRVTAVRQRSPMKTEFSGKVKTAFQMSAIIVLLFLLLIARTLAGRGPASGLAAVPEEGMAALWISLTGPWVGRILNSLPKILVLVSAAIAFFSMFNYIIKNRHLFRLEMLLKALSTVFFIGYIPGARGTWASLFACGLWMGLSWSAHYLLLPLAVIIFGFPIAHYAEKQLFHERDASRIVIDEVGGMLLAFISFRFALTFEGVAYCAVGFALFRALDILKPGPVRAVHKLKGGAGIMLDDLVSGAAANAVLQLLRVTFFNRP